MSGLTPAIRPRHAFDDLWDFDRPEDTERTFRAFLAEVGDTLDEEARLELQTQIARCLGLQRKHTEAHAVLDEVKPCLNDTMPVARVRYLLERGRVFNSSCERDRARNHFSEAWERGRAAHLDGYAVDAAHMRGIVEPDEAGHGWNLKAIALADSSSDLTARRWRGSLHNNMGWYEHGQGRYDAALAHFEKAMEYRRTEGKPAEIRVAHWCVARCLRSLGRVDEALVIQRELELELADTDHPDGFVFEEIAECFLALDRAAEAGPYFKRAHDLLSQDAFLVESEPERLERMRTLATPATA